MFVAIFQAADLFWGLWALMQAKHSIIDFGFLE